MIVPAAPPREKHSLILPLLAASLLVPLFIFRRTGPLDFWASFSLSVAFLSVLALGIDQAYYPIVRDDLRRGVARKILLGAASALLLYGIFFIGAWLARHVWPASGSEVSRIYDFKAGVSPARIALLLVVIIGPGEEIFWRGYLQRAWQARLGKNAGWLLTSAFYAAVHLGSLNPMLVLAAAAGGLFWGFLYIKYRSVLLLAVSHTLWDIMVFVVLPFS